MLTQLLRQTLNMNYMNYEDVIAKIERISDNDFTKAQSILISIFTSFPYTLPQDLVHSVTDAHAFWNGEGLEVEKIWENRGACWEYLDKNGATTDCVTPHNAMIRALIIILSPELDSEYSIGDRIDLFCSLLRSANVQLSDLEFKERIMMILSSDPSRR